MIARREAGEGWVASSWAPLRRPATYIALVLLAIAVAVMALRAWPARGQEFLLVLFACVALMLEKEEGVEGQGMKS